MEQIAIGVITTMPQNTVFALPSVVCRIGATVACEVSVDGITWAAPVGPANVEGVDVCASFIRCPTATCKVIAKTY